MYLDDETDKEEEVEDDTENESEEVSCLKIPGSYIYNNPSGVLIILRTTVFNI